MKLDPPHAKVSHRFIVYKIKILSGKVRISEEHTRFRWMSKKQILESLIEPYMRLYFKVSRK